MQHLDDGTIQELVDGEVPSHDLAPIQAHLATCGACQSRLDAARMAASEADDLLLMLDEADTAATTATVVMLPHKRPHWSRNLAWAASLVLAAGIGFASRDMILPPTQVDNRVDSTPAASTTIAPVVTGTSAQPRPATPERSTARDARTDVAEAPAPTAALPREASAAVDVATPPVIGQQETTEEPSNAGLRRERATTAPTAQLSGARPTPGRVQSFEAADAAKSVGEPFRATLQPREVDLSSAMRLLGGSIKLIDGLVPNRLEAIGDEVRVVYRVFWGDLLLTQRRAGERIEWQLTAPAGFPSESLAVLRGKVRP